MLISMPNVVLSLGQRGDIMKFEITTSGNFKNTESWLTRMLSNKSSSTLDKLGAQGVASLSRNTPIGETGKTAAGWTYKVSKTKSGQELAWYNHGHPETMANVALLIQYGHGTGTGGYVPGRDYINPAMNDIFTNGAKQLLEEMTR